jgi:hypothetical protein
VLRRHDSQTVNRSLRLSTVNCICCIDCSTWFTEFCICSTTSTFRAMDASCSSNHNSEKGTIHCKL